MNSAAPARATNYELMTSIVYIPIYTAITSKGFSIIKIKLIILYLLEVTLYLTIPMYLSLYAPKYTSVYNIIMVLGRQLWLLVV